MKNNCQSQPWPSPPLGPTRQTYKRQIRIKHPSNFTLKRRAQPRELLHSILNDFRVMRWDEIKISGLLCPYLAKQAHCAERRLSSMWCFISAGITTAVQRGNEGIGQPPYLPVSESGRHFAEHHLCCLSWGPNVPLWGTIERRVCVYKQVWTVLSCLTRELHEQIKKKVLESTAIN